ncbi:MAG: hypothetical protein U0791_13990 [Gemmataceae bacterium]
MKRLALLVAFACSSTAAAESPNPKDLAIPPAELSRAKLLVGQLASELFAEREEAQDELDKMGRLAFPALLEGLNTNPSPEVRHRCQSLVAKAAHADLQARLATFLADTEGKYEHDMPGWNQFKKLAGGAAASRATFVELLKESPNRALVLGVAGSPHELGRLIATRKQDIYQMRFPRTPNATRKEQTIADVIALMFAESHVESKHVPRSINTSVIYNIGTLNTAITANTEQAAVYKAIVANWIETRDDAASMYQAMTQAASLGLPKQGNAIAVKLIQMKGGIISYRMYAVLALARNGAKEHLPALESVFSDETAINIGGIVVNGKVEQQQIQMRDTALAAALLLTGQNTEEYGFTERYKNQSGMQYQYTNWRLPEEKRKAAFEKWKAWREKNPDFGKDKK